MVNTNIYIKNVNIYLEDTIIHNGNILITNGQIAGIYPSGEHPDTYPSPLQLLDGDGQNLVPGFIDTHIHGVGGVDVMDATETAIDTMARVLPKEGTTSFLATTITQAPENIEKALTNIANYTNKKGYAEVIGIHLEGPFIEASKKGAQPLAYITKPDLTKFEKWQACSANRIKTITMAPEHDEEGTFIEHLDRLGVNVSAGHTAATYHDMKKAVSFGVRQVTHLCNAMTGIHHRDIGVVGAAFQLDGLRAEVIADGIHVSPEMLQLVYDNIGRERIILITDAMRAKGLQPGTYELGGQPVNVTEDRAVLETDGSLAGSILKMDEGVRNMLALEGVTFHSVIEMASINPAKQIGVYDRKGSIAIGKDADLLLVDDGFHIKHTICKGVLTYEGGKTDESNQSSQL